MASVTTAPREAASRGAADVKTDLLLQRSRRKDDPAGARAAREALARRYLPLARRLARRYAHTSEPEEDLFQVAAMALLKAIDRFDPNRGSGFVAFAIPTILGELRRYFRDCAWSVHVPRRAQEQVLAVGEASERLTTAHGRPPTAQQLAEYLETSLEEVLEALQAGQAYATHSLDAPAAPLADEAERTLAQTLGAEETGYELIEAAATVGCAVRSLSERDLRLLRMRFGEELTQNEIAARMGISQMQVSRLLRRAIERLRAHAGVDQLKGPRA
jgi:RNA polymerase sigma-B factor